MSINLGDPDWPAVHEMTYKRLLEQVEKGKIKREDLMDVLKEFEDKGNYELCTVIRDVLK
jgi:hypothetical protein